MEFAGTKLSFVFLIFMVVSNGEDREEGNCPRVMKFIDSMEGRTLVGHVFKRIEIKSPDVCEANCFLEADCVSFNIGPLQDGKYWCELSNSDHKTHPGDLVYGVGTTYQPFLNHCESNPCPLNIRCQTGFTDKGYRCVCSVGFTGQDCSEVTLFVNTSPKIISTQKEQHVTFTCSVSGSLSPVITWSKSQGNLPASRSVITSEGKLTILNVTIDDSGLYVCNATSAAWTNSSSVELNVFCSLVHVIWPELSVSLYIGQAMKLSCPTSSGTELWLYNGSTSLSQDAFLDTPGILLIPSLSKDHVGNYSCVSGASLQWNVSLHVAFPETCSVVKQNISDTSGDYVIDPDGELGEAPFIVYCNMTDQGGVGVTVVSHDSESRILVNGLEFPGSYRRDIHYNGASVSQLKGLTEVATKCQQFIKYECYHSLLRIHMVNRYGWWVSRDGIDMTYWGGSTHGCACGVTNSCDNPSNRCNCDNNDFVWREDSGLLTNKLHLPVSQLRFGDTGLPSEKGYHTLGKLECYGMN